jgi:hypothetical protein
MSTDVLKREMKDMQKRLKALETLVGQKSQGGWRQAFGAMKGDPLHREAAELGAAWRAKENKRK